MRRLAWLFAIFAVGVMTWVACTDPPTIPTAVTSPAEDAPAGSAGPAAVIPTNSNTWESNGLRVTIIGDEWGPGTCHSNGGTRTLLIENVGDIERYSLLAAFTDDQPVCATSKTPTGKPTMVGPDHVKPGEAIIVAYSVYLPLGTDGICTLQADDSWGPGSIGERAFVIGDAFKVADSKCAKVCEEPDIWKEKPGSRKTVEGKWGACPEQPSASVTEEVCYECRTNTSSWMETNCDDERPASEAVPEKREIDCECIENPVVTEKCGEWNECHEHPSAGCWQEKECIKHTDYQCKPDTDEPYEETQPCTCVCVDTPDGTVSLNSSSSPIIANATAWDTGNYEVCIHASSSLSECTSDQPDYWKRCVPMPLKCDEQASWSASYSWRGHGTEYWRGILRRNGSIIKRTACVRNPFN